ncbi:MAG: L,D-transpeptidase [Bauldia sp.]
MGPLTRACALVAALFASPALAASSIVAKIDLSDQRMQVYVNGAPRYSWAVSTARGGYRTPVGAFRPQRLEEVWYSRKYDMSPMPHSIFFLGGYAIHGTDVIKRLGTPASHGCVRLHPSNAATLFALVSSNGINNTQIIVTR